MLNFQRLLKIVNSQFDYSHLYLMVEYDLKMV
nr:MAG TPA: hypothetical protein [Caudoviricetes sp.]